MRQSQDGLGVADHRGELGPIADQARIAKPARHDARVRRRQGLNIKAKKGFAHVLPLLQHRQPRQPGLHPFQDEALEQRLLGALRHTPLLIVVLNEQRLRTAPATTLAL